MKVFDILLVVLSSAGLLHGLLFALYLMLFKKKKSLPNYLLGWLLVFMAFRVGKSVLLNFGQDLEPVFIFIGLALLLLIGPLLRWYVLSMTLPEFKLTKSNGLELVPFTLIFGASLFVSREWYEESAWVIIIFSSGLLFIYFHLAFYIGLAWSLFQKVKREHPKRQRTKSQKAVFQWLHLLLWGFVLLWITYVLNILDDAVPYVIGPLLYSLVVYFLSFKAFQLRITDMAGNVFSVNEHQPMLAALEQLVVDEKYFMQSDLSLAKLSKLLGTSTQQLSKVVNEHAKRNFNDYINAYRVQAAKELLAQRENDRYTISAIAFDVGFNSLSSFNSAFKKFEGITPSAFRRASLG
ncbi:MAG: helix-turn-helix domain-containing protein [Croceivirga sp.]